MLTCLNLNYKNLFCNIGFTIGASGCLVIKGENGSGKTILLKIIAKKIRSNATILWDNKQIINKIYNRSLHYIDDDLINPNSRKIVDDILISFTKPWKTGLLIPAAIRYFQLEEVLESRFCDIPHSYKKRVMLSKLICCPADIWILDDPLEGMDRKIRDSILNLISIRCKEGGIVIASSNDDILCSLGDVLDMRDFIPTPEV